MHFRRSGKLQAATPCLMMKTVWRNGLRCSFFRHDLNGNGALWILISLYIPPSFSLLLNNNYVMIQHYYCHRYALYVTSDTMVWEAHCLQATRDWLLVTSLEIPYLATYVWYTTDVADSPIRPFGWRLVYGKKITISLIITQLMCM